MIDMRFMRLASVGLIVLAPKPVAMDILFEPPGVVVLPGVPLRLPGVIWPTIDIVLRASGVLDGVSRSFEELL